MTTSKRSSPVVTTRPDPLVWAEALRRAGGDTGRLRVHRDGSVVVLNKSRHERPDDEE